MHLLRKIPTCILLITLLFSSLRESIFADEISLMHSPEELPSYYMNPNEVKASQETLSVELDEDRTSESIISLMADRGTYVATSTETKESPLRSSLDAPDAMMKDFSIQKVTRMRNMVV